MSTTPHEEETNEEMMISSSNEITSKTENNLPPTTSASECTTSNELGCRAETAEVVEEQGDYNVAPSNAMRMRQEFILEEYAKEPICVSLFANEVSSTTTMDLAHVPTGWRKRTKLMLSANVNSSSTTSSDENAEGEKKPPIIERPKLCNFVARGNPCPHGAGCRFSHDLQTFLATRPPDLGDTCPVLESSGKCPSGFTCRFVGGHGDLEKLVLESSKPAASSSSSAVDSATATTATNSGTGEGEGEDDGGEQHRKRADLYKRLQRKKYEFTGRHERGDEADSTDARRNRRTLDLKDKVYVAPLTTVGNLPFRRLLVHLGADVTCGEMAVGLQLLKGVPSEWALTKRHPDEKLFGIQIAASEPSMFAQVAELISKETEADFIDVNMGCPIDDVIRWGGGSALLNRLPRIGSIVESISKAAPSLPLGLKMRTGWSDDKNVAHTIFKRLCEDEEKRKNIAYLTLHGRSRLARYSRSARWDYISEVCAPIAKEHGVQFLGNGDVFSYETWLQGKEKTGTGPLLGRGALIKPWLCTEIKEQRVWDISASERLEIVKKFANYGLSHWGSDERGVETTRRYLLEWMSFAYRYVPVGLLEVGYAQRMNHKPPPFKGRNELETLLGSSNSKDWEFVVEMFLGKSSRNGFHFVPKHVSNAWG